MGKVYDFYTGKRIITKSDIQKESLRLFRIAINLYPLDKLQNL